MKKQHILSSDIVAALVVTTAALLHYAPAAFNDPFWGMLFNFIRTFLYIGLLICWGSSVEKRLSQIQARHLLSVVCLLMIVWMLIREFKFRFVSDPELIRYLWYSYYIPLVLIPLLAFYLSLSLGKAPGYRLPRQLFFMLIPAVIMIAMIITNDYHMSAFIFPEDAAVKGEQSYSYGWLYYASVVWGVVLAVASVAIMTKRFFQKGKKLPLLPLVTIGIAVVYIVLYALRIKLLSVLASDVAVFYCLIILSFFEACIRCGLIQTNNRYEELFSAEDSLSVRIFDKNDRLCYSSRLPEDISFEDIMRAKQKPVMLPDGVMLHRMEISGGYVIWTEDISGLLKIRDKLKESREELQERNDFLNFEYQKEKELGAIREQNRLYDMMQSATQTQIDKTDALLRRWHTETDEKEKQKILSRIIVFGSYIKRRRDFVLSAQEPGSAGTELLENAFAESFRALRLIDIRGGFAADIPDDSLSVREMTLAYDFFEDLVEILQEDTHFLNVRLGNIGGISRLSILTDSVISGSLEEKYPSLRVVSDEDDSTALLLPLEGRSAYE